MTNYEFTLANGAVMFVNDEGRVTCPDGSKQPPALVKVGDTICPFVGDPGIVITNITQTEI